MWLGEQRTEGWKEIGHEVGRRGVDRVEGDSNPTRESMYMSTKDHGGGRQKDVARMGGLNAWLACTEARAHMHTKEGAS